MLDLSVIQNILTDILILLGLYLEISLISSKAVQFRN